MNIFKDKEAKKSIIVSLVASMLFLVFIQPIMTFIWDTLKALSLSTFEWVTDGMYKNAALGQRNWIDFLLWTSIVLFGASLIAIMFIKVTSLVRKDTQNTKLVLLESASQEHFESEKVKLKKMLNLLTWVSWLAGPLLAISTLYLTFSAYTDLQLNTSFNQRLNVLAPYIEEHETKLLRSKWATMESRKDFDCVNQYIERLAAENKIVLPKQLLD